jgi:ribosomal protein L14
MLQKLTGVVLADNSGPRYGHVIHLYGGSGRRRTSSIGGQIRITIEAVRTFIKKITFKRRRVLIKGKRRRSCIVRIHNRIRYIDNCFLWFSANYIVFIKKRWTRKFIRGKRAFGATSRFVGTRWIMRYFRVQI